MRSDSIKCLLRSGVLFSDRRALALTAGRAQAATDQYFDTNGTLAGDGVVSGMTYTWGTLASTSGSLWSTAFRAPRGLIPAYNPNDIAYFNGVTGGMATSYTMSLDNTLSGRLI